MGRLTHSPRRIRSMAGFRAKEKDLQFIVDVDGSIVDAKVIRSAHPLLDAEALRVVSSCPEKWSPGIQNGKPVRVHYIFPVVFKCK